MIDQQSSREHGLFCEYVAKSAKYPNFDVDPNFVAMVPCFFVNTHVAVFVENV
jgi:hypothetical protein